MKITAIIPARYSSTRLKGKALLDIAGKPMIQHVYERTKNASLVNDVIVATDDKRVFNVVKDFNGNVVMTLQSHKTGTDRIAEAVKRLQGARGKGQGGTVPTTTDIIVNVQGDEPLIEPEMIDEAIKPIIDDETIPVSTLKTRLADEKEILNPNVVKVVTDKNGFALYFSRLPIPYVRSEGASGQSGCPLGAGSSKEIIPPLEPLNVPCLRNPCSLELGQGGTMEMKQFLTREESPQLAAGFFNPRTLEPLHFKHIGLYVYRKDFLLKFSNMKPTPLENAEKLEQLRILENGYKIKVVETRYNSIGVDTEEDLERVKEIMQSAKWKMQDAK